MEIFFGGTMLHQLLVNWWFGARWCGSPLIKGIVRGYSDLNPNPNHQFTISIHMYPLVDYTPNTGSTTSVATTTQLFRNLPHFEKSKKSPTGPTEWTPKPEYLLARSQLTERGPLGFGPIQFLMEKNCQVFFPESHLSAGLI